MKTFKIMFLETANSDEFKLYEKFDGSQEYECKQIFDWLKLQNMYYKVQLVIDARY